MVADVRARRPRVRPGLRRVVFWVGPMLVAIAAWQIWDAIETVRVDHAIAQAFPDGVVEPQGSWDDENAARYYLAASSAVLWPEAVRFQFPVMVWETREALANGASSAVAGTDEALALIARNELSLDLVARARTLPYGAFRPGTEFNYRFSGLLHVAQLATLQTLDALRRGDGVRAGRALVARLKLLRAFESERQLAGAAALTRELQGIGFDTALLLARTRPPEAVLDELSGAFDEIADERTDQFVKTESVGRLRIVREIIDGRFWSVANFLIRPLMRHHVVGVLQVTADARQAVRLPWPDRITAMQAVSERRSGLPELPPFIAPWRLQSALRDLVRRMAAGVAAVRCARVAIALDRHKRSRGLLPDRLADLDWSGPDEVLNDPFTGRPLQYVRAPNGYVLYSVGPDAVDDGGKIVPPTIDGRPAGTTPTPDIGITVKSFPSK